MARRVDLPLPFVPIIDTCSSCAIFKLISFKAFIFPTYEYEMFLKSKIVSMFLCPNEILGDQYKQYAQRYGYCNC